VTSNYSRMGRSELIEHLERGRKLLAAARPAHWVVTADLVAAHQWQREVTALLAPVSPPPAPPEAA